MRLLICVPLLLSACGAGGEHTAIRTVGTIDNPELDEASGLAHSRLNNELLWAINDDGPPDLYAMSTRGEHRGQVSVAGASNKDWEDLAAFSFEGENFLVIADIGDNNARRPYVTLYVVAEPDPGATEAALAWRVDFSYPEGPRDAESLAVDASGEHFYVLSKREVPARMFTVPLRPRGDLPVLAREVAVLDSLPQPSDRERKNAAKTGWAWQPTAMDIAADGSKAMILTYGGVYLFARDTAQTWPEALRGTALKLGLGKIKNAEAIALDGAGTAAFLTIEKQHAPVLRIDLDETYLLRKNNNPDLR